MQIKEIHHEADLEHCRPVILELRPHFEGRPLWPFYQKQLQEQFRILYAEVAGEAVAFIGYRIQHMFYSGKTLYIDDLCCLAAHRGKGYAGALLDRIFQLAQEEACDTVSLDSGHQRNDAHRLYLNKRFRISAHHFEVALRR